MMKTNVSVVGTLTSCVCHDSGETVYLTDRSIQSIVDAVMNCERARLQYEAAKRELNRVHQQYHQTVVTDR